MTLGFGLSHIFRIDFRAIKKSISKTSINVKKLKAIKFRDIFNHYSFWMYYWYIFISITHSRKMGRVYCFWPVYQSVGHVHFHSFLFQELCPFEVLVLIYCCNSFSLQLFWNPTTEFHEILLDSKDILCRCT